MSNKQILREWMKLDYTPQLVKESRDQNGGKIFLSGCIQKAETLNQNKRIYPKRILQREVENYQKAVRENRALGECDHPESSTVSLKNVSHVMREIWWDGDAVMGKLEVLATPNGKILETLLDSNVTIGISSRGVGSTSKNESGADMVSDDFCIVAWDLVSEPSTPGAYLQISEGKEIGPTALSRADRIFRALNDIVLR